MVSTKQWVVINLSLTLVGVLLLFYIFGAPLPSIGKAQYALVSGEPACWVEWEGERSELEDIDRCCLVAAMHLSCEKEGANIRCSSGNNGASSLLNQKAYSYCRIQPYWRS